MAEFDTTPPAPFDFPFRRKLIRKNEKLYHAEYIIPATLLLVSLFRRKIILHPPKIKTTPSAPFDFPFRRTLIRKNEKLYHAEYIIPATLLLVSLFRRKIILHPPKSKRPHLPLLTSILQRKNPKTRKFCRKLSLKCKPFWMKMV